MSYLFTAPAPTDARIAKGIGQLSYSAGNRRAAPQLMGDVERANIRPRRLSKVHVQG